MPGQSIRMLGGEILAVAVVILIALIKLQLGYFRDLGPTERRYWTEIIIFNRTVVTVIAIAGAVLLWRGDGVGFYVLALGVLLSFISVGLNAWVLLIEINR
jgi:hypothetical protein